MRVRPATPDDDDGVREVIQRAFGGNDEADLVRALHASGDVVASLVAISEAGLVGHVLFSRLTIATAQGGRDAASLAPLSVLPEFQRRGIGSALVGEGLRVLERAGEPIVIVVGDPDYYRRFGFSAERALHLRSRYSGPACMALELMPGALTTIRGDVTYPPAFDAFS